MSKKRQRADVAQSLDPSVIRELTSPPGKRITRNGEITKTTVELPSHLVEGIKAEAYALTHHRRRGYQDLMTILLDYGLRAYREGKIEVVLKAKTTSYTVAVKK